ncbi:MAG: hypothetical protein A2X82_11665 [Geobacteraceae bacterium GWC2_55_20]|nr:MAG: hypothetical protein A2X82_11665 [Geobacteraceae bacterium GWC2_55_20]OGU23347.1 MAG: hypothetical protein A2X85_17750 [Geobacteraceae bacterium GWF2_54_21]HCE66871.1 sel1 repeat family protein [Geobacter sp.]
MNGLLGMLDPTNSSRTTSQAEMDFMIAEKAYSKGDFSTAVQYLRKSADAGFAAAQNNLGMAYDTGEGVQADANEALKWYTKAAKQDYTEAFNNIGCLYNEYQQYAEAFQYFSKAAAKGHSSGQLNLGLQYVNGMGVNQNMSEGIAWLKKSAAQGNSGAVSVLRELNVL